MKCKPGDLAIIIHTKQEYEHYLGAVVTVRQFYQSKKGPPGWFVSPKLVDHDGREAYIADAHLKPIRGQDAGITTEETRTLTA